MFCIPIGCIIITLLLFFILGNHHAIFSSKELCIGHDQKIANISKELKDFNTELESYSIMLKEIYGSRKKDLKSHNDNLHRYIFNIESTDDGMGLKYEKHEYHVKDYKFSFQSSNSNQSIKELISSIEINDITKPDNITKPPTRGYIEPANIGSSNDITSVTHKKDFIVNMFISNVYTIGDIDKLYRNENMSEMYEEYLIEITVQSHMCKDSRKDTDDRKWTLSTISAQSTSNMLTHNTLSLTLDNNNIIFTPGEDTDYKIFLRARVERENYQNYPLGGWKLCVLFEEKA
uniref:Uncharacterized protein n=1 Tax=Melicertus latisulcatus majanivirus TaxID=2984277 RepID=A0A9C7F0C8_9VIRU|nr:MAG: hypothetical protein [Melicertus latisulcatus majanivirus]